MTNFLFPAYLTNRIQVDTFLDTFKPDAVNYHGKDKHSVYNIIRVILFLSVEKTKDVAPINTHSPQYELLIQRFKLMSNQEVATILVAAPTFKHLFDLSEEDEYEFLQETGAELYTAGTDASTTNRYLNFYRIHREAFKEHFTGSNKRSLDALLLNSTGMTLNTLKLIHHYDEDANGVTGKRISLEELDLIEADLEKATNLDASFLILRYTNFYNIYNITTKSLLAMANTTGAINFQKGRVQITIS